MNEKQLLRLCFSAALCMGTLSVSAASTEATGSSYSVQQANVKQVSGQVLDENGEPIIGATVTLKGTKTAVPTDVDGNFSLKAPAGSKLVITYLGYSTVEVNAGEGIKAAISLAKWQHSLEAMFREHSAVKLHDHSKTCLVRLEPRRERERGSLLVSLALMKF